ncbi:hypothetical protein BDV12DRAFT_169684 [Aspergillus spectabilis]
MEPMLTFLMTMGMGTVDARGRAPLHILMTLPPICAKRHALCGKLLETGADVQARDGEGRTPFSCLARSCEEDRVAEEEFIATLRSLLRYGAGADADMRDNHGKPHSPCYA